MNYQHKDLAAGRWDKLSFVEQMANIGSEIERAINWRAKHNAAYCQQALDRSLELIDLTLDRVKGFARLKELARLRETIADYFFGTNEFASTDELLRKYFFNFTYAARRNH
ncbi:MAG: hypothetical protein NTY47_06345 [Candidatus Omnitrophica bacterium]|nr:hypothetical protein [Candidatus Omnitrophota bacterium]